jgi:hypothetical protein
MKRYVGENLTTSSVELDMHSNLPYHVTEFVSVNASRLIL